MQTGKPPIAFLAAGILVASLHAAAAQQPKNITINQGNCNLTIINTGKGDQKVSVEAGICTDQVDPSKAIRIRYVWLDAISASLLLAGKVEGDLARSVGANPYVTRNKVYDELSDLINRFGSNLAAPGLQGSTVWTTVEGQKDSASSSSQDFAPFRKRVGSPKIYNAEENTILPETDAYLSIQNTPSFPPNYAMYYNGGTVSADSEPIGMLHWVKLWRPLTRDDLQNYGPDTAKLRALFLQRKFKIELPEPIKPQSAKAWDERQNRTVAAMLHFARAGWPKDYLYALGSVQLCGTDVGVEIDLFPRRLFVQVAILDNVQGKGVLPITALKGEQITTDRLRLAEDDKDWSLLEIGFPSAVLKPDESIVVPLQLQLRPGPNMKIDVSPAESANTLAQILRYPKPLIMKDEKGKVIYRKSKEAFAPPSFPMNVDYTYGPRVRLSTVVSNGKEIKLRQFNPVVVAMQFGYETGSCPGIYVQTPDAKTPVSHGRILVGAVGPERARTDIFWHDGPALFIELMEDEPEITRIRSLKVFTQDAQGVERLAEAKKDLFLMPGMPLRIETPELQSAARIRVELEGYYRSLPSLLLQNANLDDMLE